MEKTLKCSQCDASFIRNRSKGYFLKIKKESKNTFCNNKCQIAFFKTRRPASPRKNKTFEELYGAKKAKKMRKDISKRMVGTNNHRCGVDGFWKGKTRLNMSKENHHFYGKKRPELSEEMIGKNNPNYEHGKTGKNKCIKCGDNICDNATRCSCCANKLKHGKRFKYKNIWMRSTWEISFAKWCDKNKILWEYEKKSFNLGKNCTYTPDFYLFNYDKYIEVKGYWRNDE